MAVEIIKLQFSEAAKGDIVNSRYDWSRAESPIGQYMIEWKSWKEHDTYTVHLDTLVPAFFDNGWTLEQAQEIAQKHFEKVVRSCLVNNGE